MVWQRRMLRDRLTFEGPNPSACHLAILAGVHGDEQVGFAAFDRLTERLHRQPLLQGRLSLIPGNLRAAGKKHPTRCAEGQDMNRLFPGGGDLDAYGLEPRGYDWERAQQIAAWLQDVDVMLDLHSVSSKCTPFVVTRSIDEQTMALLAGFPVDLVDCDDANIIPGTTMGCVEIHGGRGYTLECGEHRQARGVGVKIAFAGAIALLRNLGMLGPGPMNTPAPSRRVRLVHRGLVRDPSTLTYASWFESDAHVKPGALLGRDRTGAYYAPTREALAARVRGLPDYEHLVAVTVTRGARIKNRPHDAFFLGIPIQDS